MGLTPPPVPYRSLSATDAAGEAIELTKRRLFPFQFDRWLALGFTAFLDQCGRSGGGGGAQFPGGGGSGGGGGGEGGGGPDIAGVPEWIGAHLGIILAVAAGVLLLMVVFIAVILWINSRGVFMYLDNVATGRADVARPWREHKEKAASYFAWSFGLAIGTLAAVMALMVPILWAVFALVTRGPRSGPIVALLVSGLMMLAAVMVLSLFSVLLRDFAAPLQMHLGTSCGQAMGTAWDLVKASPGAFAIYVLLKIVFGIGTGIAALFAGCVTCCLGFLPVVSQVILQPLLYFERAWSLFLLKQAGYDLFPAAPTLPPPVPPIPAGAPS
jgi:hypothetical protein